jgi:hypothetical protein
MDSSLRPRLWERQAAWLGKRVLVSVERMNSTRRRLGTWLLGIGLLAGFSAAQEAASATPQDVSAILLPTGPLADLLAQAKQTQEQPRLEPWPAWTERGTEGGWGSKAPWQRWSQLLIQSALPDSGSAAPLERSQRRASLALLAKMQGRDGAGWGHLLASADGGSVAQVLPAFLPGRLPAEFASQPFDGIFRPALPPTHDPLNPLLTGSVGNSMEHQAVRLGESVFRMRVLLEADGIQVDLTHVSGPELSFKVLPPEPNAQRIALLYADWIKVGTERQAVDVKLAPGDPTYTIWGRFLSRRASSPIPRGGRMQARDSDKPRHEIEIRLPLERMEEPFMQQLARTLVELSGSKVSLRAPKLVPPVRFPEPIVIRLGTGVAAEKKLLELVDRIEESLLGQPE